MELRCDMDHSTATDTTIGSRVPRKVVVTGRASCGALAVQSERLAADMTARNSANFAQLPMTVAVVGIIATR